MKIKRRILTSTLIILMLSLVTLNAYANMRVLFTDPSNAEVGGDGEAALPGGALDVAVGCQEFVVFHLVELGACHGAVHLAPPDFVVDLGSVLEELVVGAAPGVLAGVHDQ